MFSPPQPTHHVCLKRKRSMRKGLMGAVQTAPWDEWGPPELVWLSHKGAHTWRLMSLNASSLRAEQRSAECKPSAAKLKAAEWGLNMLRFTKYTGILLRHSSCLSLQIKCSFSGHAVIFPLQRWHRVSLVIPSEPHNVPKGVPANTFTQPL